jgi:hypothetical protein
VAGGVGGVIFTSTFGTVGGGVTITAGGVTFTAGGVILTSVFGGGVELAQPAIAIKTNNKVNIHSDFFIRLTSFLHIFNFTLER